MVSTQPTTGPLIFDNKVAEEALTVIGGAGNSNQLTIPTNATGVSVSVVINADMSADGDFVSVSILGAAGAGYVLQENNPSMTWRLGKSPVMHVVNGGAGNKLVRVQYYFG